MAIEGVNAASGEQSRPIKVIDARPRSIPDRLHSVWAFRALFWPLFRELTVRKFRGTVLGVWWLVVRPLVPTVIAIITFTVFAEMETHSLPYAVFFLAGFLPWVFFQASTSNLARTFLWSRGLMQRTYFPKLLVPLASFGPPLLEFAIAVFSFILVVMYFSIKDGALYLHAAGLPIFFLVMFMTFLLSLALGMILGIVALFMRDVVFGVSYIVQVFMFLTPVMYPSSVLQEPYRSIVLVVNPLAAQVEASRWALTGEGGVPVIYFAISCAVVLGLLAILSILFFRAEDYVGESL